MPRNASSSVDSPRSCRRNVIKLKIYKLSHLEIRAAPWLCILPCATTKPWAESWPSLAGFHCTVNSLGYGAFFFSFNSDSKWDNFVQAAVGNKDIAYLQCHGDCDPVVPYKWGQATSTLLKQFLKNAEFKTYRGMMHASSDEVRYFVYPDLENTLTLIDFFVGDARSEEVRRSQSAHNVRDVKRLSICQLERFHNSLIITTESSHFKTRVLTNKYTSESYPPGRSPGALSI